MDKFVRKREALSIARQGVMGINEQASSQSGEDEALAAIVRSSQDAVIAKTVDGIVTAWNAGAEALYGYRVAEILGRPIDLTFPPEAVAEERARHARVAAGAAESGYRCTRVRADGERVDVVMSMLPVRDRAGRITGLASISRRVSDEERALQRFATLLEAAPDATMEVTADGQVAVVNRRLCDLFGYSAEQLRGRRCDELVPGLWPLPSSPGRPTAEKTPDLVAHRGDGTTFPVEVSLSEAPGGSLICTLRDVTAQRATESSLRESETRLRQLAENVSTVFTLRQIDPPAYLYVSPGIETLTGYRPEELYADPGIAFGTMVHPEDRAAADRAWNVLDREQGTATVEVRIVHRNGETRWIRSVTSVVPHPSGRPERMVGMAEDITARVLVSQRLVEAEAEARSANEAKNIFLSRMSHELRTPLNAVLGFGQLLELKLRGTPDQESVEHVLHGGRHLLGLIDDVLDIAKIEAGEIALSLETVSVPDLVLEAVRLLQPIADGAGVGLETTDPTGEALARADVQRLRQVLLNLIGNGVKYNRRGGCVRVSWEVGATDVAIAVGDDGPGIAEELLPRLFVPFDRLGAEATGIEGTGVGLALSKALATLMHGDITYDSRPGSGSVFTVTLPRATSTRRGSSSVAEQSLPTWHDVSPGARTLLYVEDNTANVSVMEGVLELRPEWRFVHAALGSLGVDLARAHRPDLVLLDLHLPDGSGLSVLRTLSADPATREIPVVVVSADASRTSIRRALGSGAVDYLTKPFDLDRLLGVLDLAVNRGDRPRSEDRGPDTASPSR